MMTGDVHAEMGLLPEVVQLYARAVDDPRLERDARRRIGAIVGRPR